MVGRYGRLFPKEDEEWRSPLERDRDIVLYSSALRRLRGVTQVAPITGGISRTHDRLIHSLKVAQVGQRLAQSVKYYAKAESGVDASEVEPLAVLVAGMVHDLGHPPFGHVAEKELQACLAPTDDQRNNSPTKWNRTKTDTAEVSEEQAEHSNRWALADSFEGNAQTFRILTRLSRKRLQGEDGDEVNRGMNLTVVSLATSMKYPWAYRQRPARSEPPSTKRYLDKKWGYYDSDAHVWEEVVSRLPEGKPGTPTINALLMDLADDVTYAVHDVLDYFRMGLMPLHEIGSKPESQELVDFETYARGALLHKSGVEITDDILSEAWAWFRELPWPTTRYTGSLSDRAYLHELESKVVTEIQLTTRLRKTGLWTPPKLLAGLEILKELTWYYIINNPQLSASQEGQRKIVRDLHTWMCEWATECYVPETSEHHAAKTKRNLRRLPLRFMELLREEPSGESSQDEQISRAAVDFITGLTDAEAANLHQHMGGTSESIQLIPWI